MNESEKGRLFYVKGLVQQIPETSENSTLIGAILSEIDKIIGG